MAMGDLLWVHGPRIQRSQVKDSDFVNLLPGIIRSPVQEITECRNKYYRTCIKLILAY